MLSDAAKASLKEKLKRAEELMTAIMEAGDSGAVTIGFGNGRLRIAHNRHEKGTEVPPERLPPALHDLRREK